MHYFLETLSKPVKIKAHFMYIPQIPGNYTAKVCVLLGLIF